MFFPPVREEKGRKACEKTLISCEQAPIGNNVDAKKKTNNKSVIVNKANEREYKITAREREREMKCS